jgi:NitT/TauT family transport system substrate-binding protein
MLRQFPKFALAAFVAAAAALMGCSKKTETQVSDGGSDMPVFSLAVSEYPSWSTFVVAKKAGLINGTEEGKPGTLEKKYGVRVKLEVKDYDPCLTMYGGGSVDAVCMTNMDSLNPALSRNSTAILPTSTSVGGDKVIGVGYNPRFNQNVTLDKHVSEYLKGKKVYGLSKSVSEYVYVRCMDKLGLNTNIAPFVNLDPAAAATALQNGSKDTKVICVWNPFALQTLRSQKGAAVLFDSSMIPEEVIDMVVMSNDALKRDGGDKFAELVCAVFYEVCKKLDDPRSGEVTLKALGEEFSNLPVEDMRLCVKDTRFYSSAQAGMKLFTDKKFQSETMPTVVKTSQRLKVLEVDKTPTIGFNDDSKQLNFATKYMQKVAAGN